MKPGVARGRVLASVALAGLVIGSAAGSARGAGLSTLTLDFAGRGAASQGLLARPGTSAGVFWNPSGLAWLRPSEGTGFASYMDYLAGVKGGSAGYAWSGAPGRGFGAYACYLASGSIPLTTWSDPVGGDASFSYSEFAVGFAGGARLANRLAVGAGLKVARENLAGLSSSAGCLDLSSTFEVAGPRGGWTTPALYIAVAGRNITLGKWGAREAEATGAAEAGLAALWPGGSAVGISFLAGPDGLREARAGLAAMLSGEFEARLGWRRRVGMDSDAAFDFPWQRGLVAGFGVSLGRFWVDYTYEDASPLDAIHRFAVRADIRPTARSN